MGNFLSNAFIKIFFYTARFDHPQLSALTRKRQRKIYAILADTVSRRSPTMTTTLPLIILDTDYPDSDGLPMAESDVARNYLVYGVEALNFYFRDQPQVYVSGNLFIYYEKGNPKAVIAPDIFVILGVKKKERRSYKVWEEDNKVPTFVLEITSKSTVSEDQGTKWGLYAYLGVREYFQYDPTTDYLKPALQGYRLVGKNYEAISDRNTPQKTILFSEVLGLELHLENGEMRFYNPRSGETLLTPLELADRDRLSRQALEEAEKTRLATEEALSLSEQSNRQLREKLMALGIDPDS